MEKYDVLSEITDADIFFLKSEGSYFKYSSL